MKASRPLILLVVIGFLIGAVALERGSEPPGSDDAPDLAATMPTVSAPEARSSTWFCAAGTAAGADGMAEQLIVLDNSGSTERTALLTAYGDEGQTGAQTVQLAANSRSQVAVTTLLSAAWAGVLIEVDGGEVGVQHVLSGPAGRATGPCASAASASWSLPTGTTVLGVDHRLVLFNPYPDDAIVDVRFETEQDTRTPSELQDLVVPGRSVTSIPVSDIVTVREAIATEVRVRTGLVVAEQVAAFTDETELPGGLAVLLGAPSPEVTWHLPAGPPIVDGRTIAVVVYNPADRPAEVDVQIVIDDQEAQGIVEPFEVTVRGGQFEIVDLRQDERVPAGVGWTGYAQSRNGVPVVAARVVRDAGAAGPVSEVTTLGSPLMAGRWGLPLGSVAGVGPVRVSVSNPGAADVTVTASRVGGGASEPVAGATDVPVAAGRRVNLDLTSLGGEFNGALRIDATGPVVVEASLDWPDDRGVSSWLALPVDGTLAELPTASSDATTSATVVLDGVLPDDTAPPEVPVTDGPDGTAPPDVPATDGPDGTAGGG